MLENDRDIRIITHALEKSAYINATCVRIVRKNLHDMLFMMPA